MSVVRQVSVFSASSAEAMLWDVPILESDLMRHYHLRNDVFLIAVQTNTVILPVQLKKNKKKEKNKKQEKEQEEEECVFEIGEDIEHVVVMGSNADETTSSSEDKTHDLSMSEYEVIAANEKGSNVGVATDVNGDRVSAVVAAGWAYLRQSLSWSEYVLSAGEPYVAHSVAIINAVCASVRNPFNKNYSAREADQMRAIHRTYIAFIINHQHRQKQQQQSNPPNGTTLPPPPTATTSSSDIDRDLDSFVLAVSSSSSSSLNATDLDPTATATRPTAPLLHPESVSPSSYEFPLWLRMSPDYLRPFTTSAQRNFGVERWKPAVSAGPLSALITEAIAVACTYQTERSSRATGGGGYLDDPTNLCLDEIKEWLTTLSRAPLSSATVVQIADRISYLEELATSEDVFQPGCLSQSTTKSTLLEIAAILKQRAIPLVAKEAEQAGKRDRTQQLEAERREWAQQQAERDREVQRHQRQLEAMKEQVTALQDQVMRSQDEKTAMFDNHKQLTQQIRRLQDEKQRLSTDLSSTTAARERYALQIQELEEENARVQEEAQAKEATHQQLEEKVQRLTEQYTEIAEKFECKICFEQKEGMVTLVPCGHVFCQDCATRQRETNACATCRGDIHAIVQLYL